jgi:hypothetical protein
MLGRSRTPSVRKRPGQLYVSAEYERESMANDYKRFGQIVLLSVFGPVIAFCLFNVLFG